MSQGFASVALPVTGLSAGSQLGTSGNFVFANSNGVTFGMSGSSQITASVTVPGPSMGISNFANSAGTSGTVSAALFFVGGSNITLSQSINGQSATVTVNGRAITADYFDNAPAMQGSAAGVGMGTFNFVSSHRSLLVAPIGDFEQLFPADLTAGTMFWNLSLSGATAAMSAAFSSYFYFGVYTANGNTLSLLNSGSVSFGFGIAATNNSTAFAGQRFLSVDASLWSSTPAFAFDQRYYLAYFWSSSGTSITGDLFGGFKYSTGQRSGSIGTNTTATSQGWAKWYGVYSATTNAVPSTINSNELNKAVAGANFIPHIVFANNTGSTNF